MFENVLKMFQNIQKSCSNLRNDHHNGIFFTHEFMSCQICRLSLLRLFRQSLVSSHIPFSSLLSPLLPQVVIQWRFAGQLTILIGFSNPQVYVDRIATMIIDTIVPIRIIFLQCVRRSVPKFCKVKQCTLLVLIDFCPVWSELLTWSSIY